MWSGVCVTLSISQYSHLSDDTCPQVLHGDAVTKGYPHLKTGLMKRKAF